MDDKTEGTDPASEQTGREDNQEALWLGVHVLTEFIFCTRAGLLEYERKKDDTGRERVAIPLLDYLPNYEVAMIQEKLDIALQLLRGAATFIGILLITILIVCFFDVPTAVVIGLSSLIGAKWLVAQLRQYLWLQGMLRQALQAESQEPDFTIAAVQQVNWWGLLQAGFESVKPVEGYRDPGMRITGSPFRLLRRGAVCIPVFQTSQTNRRLYRQHHARLAAYAHLIKTCEGAQVPVGIILYQNSYKVDVVPITESSYRAFEEGLASARTDLTKFLSGPTNPDRPRDGSICNGCRHGHPRVYRPGQTELVLQGHEIKPRFTEVELDNGKKLEYHSECGDRYGWVPLHRVAIKLGLTD